MVYPSVIINDSENITSFKNPNKCLSIRVDRCLDDCGNYQPVIDDRKIYLTLEIPYSNFQELKYLVSVTMDSSQDRNCYKF